MQVRSAALRRYPACAIGLGIYLALAAAPPAVEARSFIWKIEPPPGQTGATSHLLGSVHLANKALYPLPAAMEAAFTAAEVLVVEARVDQAARLMGQVMQHAMYRPLDTLEGGRAPAQALLRPGRPGAGAVPALHAGPLQAGRPPERSPGDREAAAAARLPAHAALILGRSGVARGAPGLRARSYERSGTRVYRNG